MHNKSNKMLENNLVRAISEDGGVVLCAIDSTAIVAEMERIHQPSAVVSAGLGRLLTAASLMGSLLKNERDSLTLRVSGEGPAGVLVAVSDGSGNVRGYATNPVVELPLRADGKLDVGAAVGSDGTLSVIRDLGLKEPYIGQVPLISGEIAEDITSYYATSEQTPSVCALGVLVNPDLSIKRAGGYLLQLLPGASEGEITRLEQNIAALPPITEFLEGDGSLDELVELVLAGFAPQILDRATTEYRCYCSRERTLNILKSLGTEELASMREQDPQAQVECHFCNAKYSFDLDALLAELAESGEKNGKKTG